MFTICSVAYPAGILISTVTLSVFLHELVLCVIISAKTLTGEEL